MQARSTPVSLTTPFLPTTQSFDYVGKNEHRSAQEPLAKGLRTKVSNARRGCNNCAGRGVSFIPDDVTLSQSIADSAPSAGELASGLTSNRLYDVLVVGAGAAGLAAAAHASFKGLLTLIIEAASVGGHAAKHLTTENHRDFASGPAIAEFIKQLHQAQESQARVLVPCEVVSLRVSGSMHSVDLAGGEIAYARSIVIASGARYGRLHVPNDDHFRYKGIHYAATGMEAALCLGEEIVVVGGGNAAGQAAVFLSGTAQHVHLVVRGDSIKLKMSPYLVERILHSPHITVHTATEVEALDGDSVLHEVTCRCLATGNRESYLVNNLFVMIGATPNTDWIQGQIGLDEKGFIRTGFAHPQIMDSPYAASRAGVFAIGDVRSNSIKRVDSAIYEGTAVAEDLRRYLSVGGQP